VMTNYQVIENASRIDVTVNDSTTLTGTVLGEDRFHDLAVLKICCGQFQPLKIADTVDPPVGSSATVFGYPTGISEAAIVTEGIVSATQYEDGQWVIQTGAATNSGNSGGPLISSSGVVLGINTYKPNEGFAISQKTMRDRIPDLLTGEFLAAPTPTPKPTATPTSLSHLAEGQRLFDLGLFDSAAVEFTQSIVKGREFGLAYAWRGRAKLELGDFREAVLDISQALEWDATIVDFYRWRGDSYTGLRIYNQAAFDFGQVISRDPIPTAADYHAIASAHLKSGEYWLAIDEFTQAILLDPTQERFEFRGAAYYQSAGDLLTNQWWSAISDFDQAIRMGPTASHYEQRGDTYSRLGEDVKAQSDWDKACDLDIARCK